VTEEPQPGNAIIAGVLITYPERPGLTIGELQFRLEGLVSLFTLLEDPALVLRRRIIYFPGFGRSRPPYSLRTLQDLTGLDVEVLQVRYNPVLEIILGVGVVATGLLALWRRISKARKDHYEANIKQTEAEMREDDAEVNRWRSEAAIQEQILRAEITEVLRNRLHDMEDRQIVAENEEDTIDRMLNRAVGEIIEIERIVPVDEDRRPIKE
jgi:hypothetical protein